MLRAPIWIMSVQMNWAYENLALVNESIHSALWYFECNENDEIVHVNWSHAFRQILGYHDILDFPNKLDSWSNLLHPEDYEKGYQTLQGLYAIGSGGLFGKGLGESMQKLGFIPEAQNDMIFSVICEELGLFGAVCLILLYLLIIWRLMIIANNASDLYGALIVVGIMAHLSIQVLLNIAVVTNTIPNTGVSLPFISYGGTSVLFLLAEMGLALSVAKGIKFEVN